VISGKVVTTGKNVKIRAIMSIGPELRDARVRARLSAKQLAERTKLKLEKIEALEKSDFTQLPRGIYLYGVVKAYAQEVGVDAKSAVERLREEIAAAEESARLSEDAPEWISERPENNPAPRQRKGAARQPWLTIAPLAAASARSDSEFGARQPSAVAAPEPESSARARFDTRSLTFAALGLLAAVGFGMYLRSATRGVPVPRPNDTVATAGRSARPDTAAVDASKVTSVATDMPSRAVDRNARAAIASPAPVARPVPVEPPPAEGLRPNPSGEPLSPAPVSSTDVSGTWDLRTQVESASLESRTGLRLGYRIDFRQNGDQIRGSGYKATENGQAIAAGARTPITLHGTIEGRELVLTFTEQGALGTSNGRFVLRLGADQALRGSFQSDAGKSRGSIDARRRP
jgi:hypothetical protein